MNAQYELLTKMLKLLKTSDLRFTRMSRVEYLIYRIKILLLRHERCSAAELHRLCPIAALEDLHRLIVESANHDSALTLVQQLEAGLEQVALRFEEPLVGVKAAPAAVMASGSYGF
jgi:hypothetical protein